MINCGDACVPTLRNGFQILFDGDGVFSIRRGDRGARVRDETSRMRVFWSRARVACDGGGGGGGGLVVRVVSLPLHFLERKRNILSSTF